MSIHDETWDCPICEHCHKEVPYGEMRKHRHVACVAPKEKTYKLNLNWETQDDGSIDVNIWDGHFLSIEFNGEDFYNVEHYNQHGNEIEGICGAETVEAAKINAEKWLDEQLLRFMVEA